MRLVTRVEIAYFRSIYKQRADRLAGVNVFFGRNDAGKSNVLRALNLFFNGQSNPGQPFVFERDFCHGRRAEAEPQGEDRRNIRKFVYVKLWFRTPANWRRSLGEEFWVKKQWSVTREQDPHFETSVREQRSQQYLTRFLNTIRFHYVPAIKDRRIFEHLLGQIYGVISRDAGFTESLAGFREALQERTGRLSTDLLGSLGVNSFIAPPEDLTDLFRSLDFETNSEHGDSYSLMLQRGDGIQVRHIPTILAFLSDESREYYHIWGLEEPENSLELANAIEEANRICQLGASENKQIFVTSHSPAFFALESDEVRRFFVSRSGDVEGRPISIVSAITEEDSPADLMGETPHLPVISSYLRAAHKDIQALEQARDQLTEELENRDRPAVFVEGESDGIVFTRAWALFVGEEQPFDFVPAGGTTKMESLARDGDVLGNVAPGRLICALVDNDKEGRTLCKKRGLNRAVGSWMEHPSNGVHWCKLPFLDGFRDFMKELKIDEAAWPGSLENLFSVDLRLAAIEAGVLETDVAPHDELLEHFKKIQPFIVPTDDGRRLFILKTKPECKVPLANWIVARSEDDPDCLEPLRTVMEGLNAIFNPDDGDHEA